MNKTLYLRQRLNACFRNASSGMIMLLYEDIDIMCVRERAMYTIASDCQISCRSVDSNNLSRRLPSFALDWLYEKGGHLVVIVVKHLLDILDIVIADRVA